MQTTILILPGLYNSGESHWQTRWEALLPNAKRVQQANWDSPVRTEWVETVDRAIAESRTPVVLVAHSLGCATTAWWAARHAATAHAEKVKGALLVAPPDVERESFSGLATGFAPMPHTTLPFPAIVVASSDDPWCELPRAKAWAAAWGAQFHDIGARGHINGESGLGDWPQGRSWIEQLNAGNALQMQ